MSLLLINNSAICHTNKFTLEEESEESTSIISTIFTNKTLHLNERVVTYLYSEEAQYFQVINSLRSSDAIYHR